MDSVQDRDNAKAPSLPDEVIETCRGPFRLKTTVAYPNGGYSYYYVHLGENDEDAEGGLSAALGFDAVDGGEADGNMLGCGAIGSNSSDIDAAGADSSNVQSSIALIVDDGICEPMADGSHFNYSDITTAQNDYVHEYGQVYRLLRSDLDELDGWLKPGPDAQLTTLARTSDRAEIAEASPLERDFEEHFAQVYGSESTQCLWKEYGVTDVTGSTRYLDYVVETDEGRIAVEENGVNYHHPQVIGESRYRDQLLKQNSAAALGIKLYRFSSEDCRFGDRLEDDIRSFFGDDPTRFHSHGLAIDRPFQLYEHQEDALARMREARAKGVTSFLAVLPTASGKSMIAEEDLVTFARENGGVRALVLVPNRAVFDDWQKRINDLPEAVASGVTLRTYASMELHFAEFAPDAFDYIVVDEAHHAVAPGMKRMIQHFQPRFLLGLTATDERLDKRKLSEVFGMYRSDLSLSEAMERGIVARANVYRVETNIDLSRVRINRRDYVSGDLEKSIRVTSRNDLIADVICNYFCEGDVAQRQGVVFCVNTTHASEMERVLRARGIEARAYSSKSRDPEGIMRDFRERRIRFLCACQMISEGWDYPELGILVMARPTLSKVLYLQQLGRGLRRTAAKNNVFVVDVVDEYGSAVMPCSMHSIFRNSAYVPFGDILRRDYEPGEMIVIDGLVERVERITEVDVLSFSDRYGDYLSTEQLAREYFVNTGTITSWVRKGRIAPSASFAFGSRRIDLFSPEDVARYRAELGIPVHDDSTILDDFFDFLEERDYSLSYKMPFVLSLLQCMGATGDAPIDDVLAGYTAFYQERLDAGLPIDRRTCPYTAETLADTKFMQRSMLVNPFEKFERKRFLYYSKDLGLLSMNHALHARLTPKLVERIRVQMRSDLESYYAELGGLA